MAGQSRYWKEKHRQEAGAVFEIDDLDSLVRAMPAPDTWLCFPLFAGLSRLVADLSTTAASLKVLRKPNHPIFRQEGASLLEPPKPPATRFWWWPRFRGHSHSLVLKDISTVLPVPISALRRFAIGAPTSLALCPPCKGGISVDLQSCRLFAFMTAPDCRVLLLVV